MTGITGLFIQKLAQSHLKNLPEPQRKMFAALLEKNPDFFIQIAKEIQEKVGAGVDQMQAAQEVFALHRDELAVIMKDIQQ